MGVIHWYKADYGKAWEYNEKALNIRLELLGEEHPDTADSYNNMGIVYSKQGNYDKGLEYLNNNDSYHYFEPLGDLIKTGPTRTNVMDLILAIIPVT